MSKEEKPYLQDLFEHMHNEHGLILTQYEMLEILCICGKEYDTVQFELGEIDRQNKSLSSQLTAYKEALERILNLSHDRGISGCTYGDTDYDSESAAYGYNTCLDYIKRDIEDVLTKAKNLIE